MATRLHIPNPCSEKWAQMDALQPDCRYCAVCDKNIVDFTGKTDAEILQHLRLNAGKVCGKFRADQLQRPLWTPVPYAGHARKTGFTAIAASFAALLSAQQPVEQQPLTAPDTTISTYINEREVLGRVLPYAYLDLDSVRFISGKITDESGESLLGVRVTFAQSEYEVSSDLDGFFELPVPLTALKQHPLEIRLRYTGYPEKTVPVPKKALEEDLALLPEMTRLDAGNLHLMGEIVIADPEKKHPIRRFFKKLFR